VEAKKELSKIERGTVQANVGSQGYGQNFRIRAESLVEQNAKPITVLPLVSFIEAEMIESIKLRLKITKQDRLDQSPIECRLRVVPIFP